MSGVINVTFANAQPTLVLRSVAPQNAPAEFSQVIVGRDGDDVVTDDLDGFTTDPLAYYILARN